MRLQSHSYYLKNMLDFIETEGSDSEPAPIEKPSNNIIKTGDSEKGIESGVGAIIQKNPYSEI